jgi:hypothetical protein
MAVDLYWIPLGAGGRSVRFNGRVYEALIAAAHRVLDAVAAAPTPVWGRDELGAGEMWNSNSLISWALEGAGVAAGAIRAPAGGRAPGWDAGLVVARRPAAASAPPPARETLHRGAAGAKGEAAQ